MTGTREPANMERAASRIVDTFAEAFDMRAARVVITAQSPRGRGRRRSRMTGFATSVIGCKVEAGIEAELAPADTPDGGRASACCSSPSTPTAAPPTASTESARRFSRARRPPVSTACLRRPSVSNVGGQLRHFGDKFQSSKLLDGQRYWRIPVMEGEFLVAGTFGVQKAIGGGNFLILGKDQDAALAAAEAAVDAMRKVRGVMLPFPGGIVRPAARSARRTTRR